MAQPATARGADRRLAHHRLEGVVLVRAPPQVAGASTDPFGPDVPDVATTAHALLWEAELSRLEDRATVDAWARAASQWDLLGRPHQAGYCRWRGAQAALRAGRGSVATRLAVGARADARQHVPLADAAAATLARVRAT